MTQPAPKEAATSSGREWIRLLLVAGGVLLIGSIWLAKTVNQRQAVPQEESEDEEFPPLQVGDKAPAVKGEGWLNGGPPSLSGRPFLLIAFAHWCRPCRAETRELVGVHKLYPKLPMLGMTVEDHTSLSKTRQFLKDTGADWPVAYGALKSAYDWRAARIPSVWLVGADGTIVWTRQSSQPLEEAIQAVLATPEKAPGKSS